ncbi:MAG: translation initiation factor IF-3 [Phycisphaerales bacterium]|nr:translation initiation factor IF-3 [Phycisphaerales bacterium]
MNREIRISPVRLVDEDNNQVGVVELQEAYRLAEEAELDLVEVAPHSRPPVCRIMDYGKHRYEESKKEQRARAKTKAAEMKEVRLGRTIKVDPHDIAIRVKRAHKFLMAGHKVQITQQFRGREMMHRHLGREILQRVVEQLADVSKVEIPPRQVGNRMHIILMPDRDKIRAIQKEEAKQAQAEGREAAEALKPDVIEPDAVEPDAVEPEVVEPEVVEPEVVEPEVVEPEVVEPEVVEPEVVEPEVVEPEVVEPEVVEPQAEAETREA